MEKCDLAVKLDNKYWNFEVIVIILISSLNKTFVVSLCHTIMISDKLKSNLDNTAVRGF